MLPEAGQAPLCAFRARIHVQPGTALGEPATRFRLVPITPYTVSAARLQRVTALFNPTGTAPRDAGGSSPKDSNAGSNSRPPEIGHDCPGLSRRGFHRAAGTAGSDRGQDAINADRPIRSCLTTGDSERLGRLALTKRRAAYGGGDMRENVRPSSRSIRRGQWRARRHGIAGTYGNPGIVESVTYRI